jgi:hypothetical protein
MGKTGLYERFRIKKVHVPEKILHVTQEHLRTHERVGNEGMVLWTGIKSNRDAFVKTCIHPVQQCTAVSFDIPLDENQRINTLLKQSNEVIIAQVHSHPGSAFHSSRDDGMPITFTIGLFSLVVPNFCKKDLKDLSELSIWEHIGKGNWQEIKHKEVAERFRIIREGD